MRNARSLRGKASWQWAQGSSGSTSRVAAKLSQEVEEVVEVELELMEKRIIMVVHQK